MNVRATTIATIATALAALVALPAAPALAAERPASAAHQTVATPTPVDQLVGAPEAPAGAAIQLPHTATPRTTAAETGKHYQGIDMTIATGGTVGLQFVSNDISANHYTLPTNIPNGGTASLQMWQDYPSWYPAYGAYGTSTARIYDHGKPTEFWVKMYASVWYYPYDKASCEIYRGDPAVTGTKVDFSPYACGATSVDHSDPWKITFTVSPTQATVVTDPSTQSALLQQACDGPNAVQDCFYTPTSVSYIEDKPQVYGQPVSNPTSAQVKTRITAEHTYGTENTIGVEYSTKLTLWEIWSNSLTLNYEHTWTDSRTFSQSVDVDVPSNTISWLTISATLDQITGDFLVRHNGQVFAIHGATVTMPDAQKSATITAHNAPIGSPQAPTDAKSATPTK